jgi:hypothetical protein
VALKVARVVQQHSSDALAEIIKILERSTRVEEPHVMADRDPQFSDGDSESLAAAAPEDRLNADASPGLTASDVAAVEWIEIGRRPAGDTYRWPKGEVDTYGEIVVFKGTGVFAGVVAAVAPVTTPGKTDIVGFITNEAATWKRPLTVFFAADDYPATHEYLAMLRGNGGGRGRKGFGPSDPLPDAYQDMTVEILRDRIQTKWNRFAVVAGEGERGTKTMLNHTAIQARLRGIA